jgi:hypothetical protein
MKFLKRLRMKFKKQFGYSIVPQRGRKEQVAALPKRRLVNLCLQHEGMIYQMVRDYKISEKQIDKYADNVRIV